MTDDLEERRRQRAAIRAQVDDSAEADRAAAEAARAAEAAEAAKRRPRLTKLHIALDKQRARPWVVRNFLLRLAVTMIAAAGGTGKTQFLLQCLFMFALGLPFAGFAPVRRCKVIIVSLEEDIEEIKRRLEVICRHYIETVLNKKFSEKSLAALMLQLDNYLWIHEPGESGRPVGPIVVMGERDTPRTTDFHDQLMADVREHKPDIVAFDPLIKMHRGLSENDASHGAAISEAFREIAVAGQCAVVFLHHTSKALSGVADNAHSARGTGAFTDSVRVQVNMASMSFEEAEEFGLGPDAHLDYVLVGDPKQNYARKSLPRHMEKVTVPLTTLQEDKSPDFGFVLVERRLRSRSENLLEQPWLKPFQDEIDKAWREDEPYTTAKTGKGKRVAALLQQHVGGKDVERVLNALVRLKVIEVVKHHSKTGKRTIDNACRVPPPVGANAGEHI